MVVNADVSKLLTAAELSFLRDQKIPVAQVMDGRKLSGRARHSIMDNSEKRYYIGTLCEKAGHRLRSKRGACIQCDTRNIGFYRRTYEPGTVYIMGSVKSGILKVGTTKDIDVRNKKNNWEGHGGTDDWEVLFEQQFENAGKVELDAHARLERFNVPGSYLKDRKTVQNSRELFRCPFVTAKGAILMTKEKQLSKEWTSPNIRLYDFGKPPAQKNLKA